MKTPSLSRLTKIIPNGMVYIWGSGKDGRLGIETEKSYKYPVIIPGVKFSQISLGYHHSAGVSNNGDILTWGKGNRG